MSTDEEYADACDSPPVIVEVNSFGYGNFKELLYLII
jgi:hypothetical protein